MNTNNITTFRKTLKEKKSRKLLVMVVIIGGKIRFSKVKSSSINLIKNMKTLNRVNLWHAVEGTTEYSTNQWRRLFLTMIRMMKTKENLMLKRINYVKRKHMIACLRHHPTFINKCKSNKHL
jgi:hypothetical protein